MSDRLPSRPPARRGPPSGGRGRAQASATFEVFADDVSGRPRRKGSGTPGRATIEIRGRTVPAPELPRATDPERRRSARRPIERVGSRPDRVAMWALLMGLLLILVAIGTAGGPAATIFFAL